MMVERSLYFSHDKAERASNGRISTEKQLLRFLGVCPQENEMASTSQRSPFIGQCLVVMHARSHDVGDLVLATCLKVDGHD